MKAVKMTINVILGICTMLVFNENFGALWLNGVGLLCFFTLLAINPQCTTQHK